MSGTGGMEKMAGKVTHKPELEAKGERRQVCRDFAVIWSGMTYRFAGRLLGDCFVLGAHKNLPCICTYHEPHVESGCTYICM